MSDGYVAGSTTEVASADLRSQPGIIDR